MTMKSVNIADLKARLSEHLRHVRRGHVLTVFDRKTPVAQVVPYATPSETLRVRHPKGEQRLQEVPLPPPLGLEVDVVEVLLEEREGER